MIRVYECMISFIKKCQPYEVMYILFKRLGYQGPYLMQKLSAFCSFFSFFP
jgi:hypothetical protein